MMLFASDNCHDVSQHHNMGPCWGLQGRVNKAVLLRLVSHHRGLCLRQPAYGKLSVTPLNGIENLQCLRPVMASGPPWQLARD